MPAKRNELPSAFQERLREIMSDTLTTQKALAEALGTKPQSISQYVNGQSEPSFSRLKDIADYFNVSADWLIGISDDRNRRPSVADDYGLNEAACKQLREYRYYFASGSSFMDYVNAILSSPQFPEFINSINSLISAYKSAVFFKEHPETLPEWINSIPIPETPESARVRYLYLLNNPTFAISIEKVALDESAKKLLNSIIQPQKYEEKLKNTQPT